MAAYLGQGAVAPCILLLAVQADLDALAQESKGPCEHVPRWARQPVVHREFSGPDAGGVVTSAPDTCNLSSWLPSYLRAGGELEQEG